MPDSIDKAGEGFEFCDGGEGVEISDENVAELADSLLSVPIEDFEKKKAAKDPEYVQKFNCDFQYISSASKCSDTVLIRNSDGRVVGFGAIDAFRHSPYKGRRVVEITKVTVLPEARGKKLSYELADRLMGKLQKQWPDGIFIVMTKTPEVKRVFGSRGFKSAGMTRADVLFGFSQSKRCINRRTYLESLGWDLMVSNTSPDEIDLTDLREETIMDKVASVSSQVRGRVGEVLSRIRKRVFG